MLIAEDVLLLMTDDATGKPIVGSTELDHALAGGVLLELAMAERVDVEKGEGFARGDRVVVTDASPTGDAVLDDALARIADQRRRKPEYVVAALRKGLRTRLYERLAERGVLRRETSRALGLFPTTRWPAADPTPRRRLRQDLHDALVVGVEPEPRIGAVVSLVYAVKAVRKLAGTRENRKLVQARAKAIGDSEWAATAVRKAVEAVHASLAAGTTGSGG